MASTTFPVAGCSPKVAPQGQSGSAKQSCDCEGGTKWRLWDRCRSGLTSKSVSVRSVPAWSLPCSASWCPAYRSADRWRSYRPRNRKRVLNVEAAVHGQSRSKRAGTRYHPRGVGLQCRRFPWRGRGVFLSGWAGPLCRFSVRSAQHRQYSASGGGVNSHLPWRTSKSPGRWP